VPGQIHATKTNLRLRMQSHWFAMIFKILMRNCIYEMRFLAFENNLNLIVTPMNNTTVFNCILLFAIWWQCRNRNDRKLSARSSMPLSFPILFSISFNSVQFRRSLGMFQKQLT